jgi:RNA polymerase sigma factor (sigma-70 family)
MSDDAPNLLQLLKTLRDRLRRRHQISDADADDVIQDALLALLSRDVKLSRQGLPQREPDGTLIERPCGFLWVAIVRASGTRHRAGVRRDGLAPCVTLDRDATDAATSHDAERDLEGRDALLRAIDALPAEQAEALTLRDIDGLSYAQIAARADCNEATARQRVSRARAALRDSLHEGAETSR